MPSSAAGPQQPAPRPGGAQPVVPAHAHLSGGNGRQPPPDMMGMAAQACPVHPSLHKATVQHGGMILPWVHDRCYLMAWR